MQVLKLLQIFSEAVSRFCRQTLLVLWPKERPAVGTDAIGGIRAATQKRRCVIHRREKNFNHNLPLCSHPCENLVQFSLQVGCKQETRLC